MGFCALIERLLGRHAEARALVLHELAGLSDSEAAATAMLKLELAIGRLCGGLHRGPQLGPGSHGDRPAARREQARRELARARTLFDASGAGLFQARALREERRLNARAPRQSQRSGHLNGLTRRETEIASLVQEGMTNRQIAQRLYLSPRTVEVHLSHILAKLDITTRSAVAPAMSKCP